MSVSICKVLVDLKLPIHFIVCHIWRHHCQIDMLCHCAFTIGKFNEGNAFIPSTRITESRSSTDYNNWWAALYTWGTILAFGVLFFSCYLAEVVLFHIFLVEAFIAYIYFSHTPILTQSHTHSHTFCFILFFMKNILMWFNWFF